MSYVIIDKSLMGEYQKSISAKLVILRRIKTAVEDDPCGSYAPHWKKKQGDKESFLLKLSLDVAQILP